MNQAKEDMKTDYVVIAHVRDDSKPPRKYSVTFVFSSDTIPTWEEIKQRIMFNTTWTLDDIDGMTSWWFIYESVDELKKEHVRIISEEG